MTVTFLFHHPILKPRPLAILMPLPPRRDESVHHENQHYRVEDVQYDIGKDPHEDIQARVNLRAVM